MIKNAKLENLFKLSCKVTVIVPGTTNVNEIIDNSKYVDQVASLLSDCFGGATSSVTLGYWKSPVHGLIKENSVTVFSYCAEKDLQENIDQVIEMCEYLRDELKQEAIALEVNGEMYFI